VALGPYDRKRRRGARGRGRADRAPRLTPVRVAGLIALAVVFFAGLAIGKALEQAPRPGGSQTIVQTLAPTTLAPPATVTVTVSSP
jgi:hypothetical protein